MTLALKGSTLHSILLRGSTATCHSTASTQPTPTRAITSNRKARGHTSSSYGAVMLQIGAAAALMESCSNGLLRLAASGPSVSLGLIKSHLKLQTDTAHSRMLRLEAVETRPWLS